MMTRNRSSSGWPATGVPCAPEGMVNGPVSTLALSRVPGPPLDAWAPDEHPPLELQLHQVPFSLGHPGLEVPGRPAAPRLAPPVGPDTFPHGPGPGASLSACGSRLATDHLPEIRVVSPLPPDAESVTIQPHEGTAVLAISVRDAEGLHQLRLSCADVLSGWWKLDTDRLGRTCWHSGEAVLRLPKLQGNATVELTLVPA